MSTNNNNHKCGKTYHTLNKNKKRSTAKKTNTTQYNTTIVAPPVGALLVEPGTIKGSDDLGNFYNSHAALTESQQANRSFWYAVNAEYWLNGGGGKTDEEVMTGDEGGLQDAEEGLAFLDRLLRTMEATTTTTPTTMPRTATSTKTLACSSSSLPHAVDIGAGVGRITKHILLKRYHQVHLMEGDLGWSKRSRVYLGKKRASRCTFGCIRLEDLKSGDILAWTGKAGADLIWLQWTLQYLTDNDAIVALKYLAEGLVVRTGILILKENRPFGHARTDRFQMDTPSGSGKYDITRTDEHHRYLLQQAGLTVKMTEQGDETNTYAVYK